MAATSIPNKFKVPKIDAGIVHVAGDVPDTVAIDVHESDACLCLHSGAFSWVPAARVKTGQTPMPLHLVVALASFKLTEWICIV